MEIAKGYSPHMPDRDVKKLIQTTDKQRGAYYEYFTGSNWRDADHYDLSIDYENIAVENVHLGDSLLTLAYNTNVICEENDTDKNKA